MSTILKKYYLDGKKHKEIAEDLASTENAVQLQKGKAIKLLKQKLLMFGAFCLLNSFHLLHA